LLFQTILDIANNKEIQKIILKSQISRGIFPNPDVKFSLTKKQLGQMYFIGLLLSKFINTARMQSIVGKYQYSNQVMQNEISDVIEKNPTLKGEITKLQNSECDCENENTTVLYFPVLCTILFPLFYLSLLIGVVFQKEFYFIVIIHKLVLLLNCSWYPF
jgi:hypothetical protein